MNSTTIEEPYYAEWLGAACACSSDPVANAERLIQANPLAAFSAFARAVPVEHRNAIHALLKGWLEDDQHRGR
ncbi:hypothetical protein, partial [Rhodoplanes roseus]|uniref:hypothetical protein n=1 Tax=Rhodoplanes roseus TaxID=29409 RepID=UPI001AEC76CA